MTSRPLRLLLVGFPNSVHTVRWVDRVADFGWDVHLFPSFPTPGVLPSIAGYRNVTIYGAAPGPGVRHDASVDVVDPGRGTAADAPRWLADVIERVRPDLVHSHEIQHGAYLALEARRLLGASFPRWIVSVWGSDLVLFGRLGEHRDRIRAVLAACDFLHCEGARDRALARELGFRGADLPMIPIGGGLDVDALRPLRRPQRPSERRTLLLKGYQHFAGRALVGLRAVVLAARALRGYRVVVPLVQSNDVRIAAELASQDAGIPIETPAWGPFEDSLRRTGAARAAIGLSISDGVSASMLEAMSLGTLPIQPNTGCHEGWVVDGESALLVPPEDPAAVADAIVRAVTDDELVDRAAERNERVLRERLDPSRIREEILELYGRAAGGLDPQASAQTGGQGAAGEARSLLARLERARREAAETIARHEARVAESERMRAEAESRLRAAESEIARLGHEVARRQTLLDQILTGRLWRLRSLFRGARG